MADTKEEQIEEEGQTVQEVPKKRRHRKDKPWDTDDIDHWKVVTIQPEEVNGPFLEESSFATLFPKYREKYLREMWPHITTALKAHGIDCVLDLIEGSMTVKTTRKTYDPYIILKSRDLIKLLARSVPFQQAVKILNDDVVCDIVKIGNIVRNKEKFIKRRQRLLGPNGNTLKALEILTECYLLVQGNTVSCMGSYKGLKQCRKIIIDCLKNIHPIYHIKQLMIKRELAKDPTLAKENWDRFLPKFKKQNPKKKGTQKIEEKSTNQRKENQEEPEVETKKDKKKKKEYTPFPPPQTPRKVDLQIESGEYFLKPKEIEKRDFQKKMEKQAQASEKKKVERAKAFIAPTESKPVRSQPKAEPMTIEQLKEKFKKQGEKRKFEGTISESIGDYIARPKKNKN